MTDIKVAGIISESIADGSGLRYVLFAQGCDRHCEGCHNESTHSADAGEPVSPNRIIDEMRRNPLLDGITLTGGEPFLQPKPLAGLARLVHEMGLNVWTFTGYTFEELLGAGNPDWNELLSQSDVLVDGPFIEHMRSPELTFRGSSNQRLIDVQSSLKLGRAVEI